MNGNQDAPVKLSLPLEFQQTIFKELRKEDELLILARGLGLLRIVTNLLHSYDAAGGNLVLVVGATERENKWIGEALAEHAIVSQARKCRGLQEINTDLVGVEKRQRMYSEGGIFSVTSQILVVDFLAKVLDPTTVTGIIVLHAERVTATSVEAFILREYRQKNRDGFLKAVSDNPEPFTYGYAPLSSMMRNLFLKKASLYPRFQVDVAKSLEGRRKAEVIELEVPMTESMKDIQTAIMECIEVSLQDLKKSNPGQDVEDWNLDAGLHRRFDLIVRRQLDPLWHRTSFRTRQVIRDLALLQNMLLTVLTEDPVSFNRYLDSVLAASQPPPGSNRQNQSPWLFLDAADTIFETARRRVYTGKLAGENDRTAQTLHPVLEELPKWGVLSEVMEEIERDMYFNPQIQDASSGAILIMASDRGTCRQLREYLQTMNSMTTEAVEEEMQDGENMSSAAFMMRRKLRNYIEWKKNFNQYSEALFRENQKAISGEGKDKSNTSKSRCPPNKRRRVRGGASAASMPLRGENGVARTAGDREAHIQSLLAELEPTEEEADQKEDVIVDPLEDMEQHYELFDLQNLVVVHPFDEDMDEHILDEIKPRYVIMYEPDAAFIRRVEVYRSSHTDRSIRVYFMYYEGSVEEQRYLSSVRREKDAFTKLIRERGSMAMSLDTATLDPEEAFLRTINTRIAGGGRLAATAEPPRVVVDTREFRSSLPSLLHGSNIIIVPCQLQVGDYVLTPDVVVERKSIRDLISSFSSGRLFNQVEKMMAHYKYPMLLIEFDQNKSFTLEPFADLSLSAAAAAGASPDLQSKIVMLTIAFPRLRIIWSSSPYQTADIFSEIKKQQEEPDPIKAVSIGLEDGEDPESGRAFSQVPLDMLAAVPGVTEKNSTRITLNVNSLWELANLEEDVLSEVFGREAGRQMYRFFNRNVIDE